MHDCPHCRQELRSFAFWCPRCGKLVGKVNVEGVMLVKWWLNADHSQQQRCGVKTLKRGTQYIDVASVSPEYPQSDTVEIVFSTTKEGESYPQRIRQFFSEAVDPSQEWNIQ